MSVSPLQLFTTHSVKISAQFSTFQMGDVILVFLVKLCPLSVSDPPVSPS